MNKERMTKKAYRYSSMFKINLRRMRIKRNRLRVQFNRLRKDYKEMLNVYTLLTSGRVVLLRDRISFWAKYADEHGYFIWLSAARWKPFHNANTPMKERGLAQLLILEGKSLDLIFKEPLCVRISKITDL